MIDFLLQCPSIRDNPLFFNFGNIEDDANQAITSSEDVALRRPFVDGSISKRFTFSIDSFKSVAYNPIIQGYSDENIEGFNEVQDFIDWINEQGDVGNFPNFGENYLIEKMETVSETPTLLSVETSLDPVMAIYRVTIAVDYIDFSKRIWNK